ncbi:MAG: histidine--tRNA ligase [Oscillospiraceae bacterium]|jgi:histidyl-tRNA synthetase|nr:histidine--tRNA ligase [Oscillospiraceae bacterium]
MGSSIIKAQRGTKDILPSESFKWSFLENLIEKISLRFNFKKIRTPIFESTSLFDRSVGNQTDVVQKEMYTFFDKAKRSISLRPEGTASVARSVIEHSLFKNALPLKFFYVGTFYRYEKPQSGRFREFYQFGAEIFGSSLPEADIELILFAKSFFDELKIRNLLLKINSMGCSFCRESYNSAVYKYFNSKKSKICSVCLARLKKNPLRILDCKDEECRNLSENAPSILNFLCKSCCCHFESVKFYLDVLKIKYKIDSKIVRGLDYYNRTVFEFVNDEIGNQSAVCGGGRYDDLVEKLGGPFLPAIGFAIGIERLFLIMEKQKVEFKNFKTCDIYIANTSNEVKSTVVDLSFILKNKTKLICEYDILGRNLKSQIKYADKIKAKFVLVIGSKEITQGFAIAKDMNNKKTFNVSLKDAFLQDVLKIVK